MLTYLSLIYISHKYSLPLQGHERVFQRDTGLGHVPVVAKKKHNMNNTNNGHKKL